MRLAYSEKPSSIQDGILCPTATISNCMVRRSARRYAARFLAGARLVAVFAAVFVAGLPVPGARLVAGFLGAVLAGAFLALSLIHI